MADIKQVKIGSTTYDIRDDSKAPKSHGIHYIEGTGSTAGTWLGAHTDITEYYSGLVLAYKIPVAGATATTLNINGLGAVTVVKNATSAISTNFAVNSVIFLVYTVDSNGTAYWKAHDYDSNTKTSTGTSQKADTKLFLAGATTQAASPTTYSNSKVYIGTDNCLYSNGTKVATSLSDLGITATAAELNKMDGVTATTTELNYVDGVTSSIQTQLNGKQASVTGAASTITGDNLTASRALISNSSGKVAVSAVTSTELGYLDGVTSAIQTQLNGKQATITGGVSSVVSSNFTANRALVSNSDGKAASSAVTSTELGYLDGVTSNIQTQLNNKFPDSEICADLDTLLTSGYQYKIVKINADTIGSPYKLGASAYAYGLVISCVSGTNYGVQYAFLTGDNKSPFMRKLTPVNDTPTIGDWVSFYTENNIDDFTGASSSAAGKHGFVPAPAAGKETSFLRGDGSWVIPTNTTYTNATTSAAGLMSAADKTKLNGITESADSVSFTRSLTSGTKIGTITINGTGTDIYCEKNTDTNTTYSAGSGLSLSSTTFSVGTVDCGTWS